MSEFCVFVHLLDESTCTLKGEKLGSRLGCDPDHCPIPEERQAAIDKFWTEFDLLSADYAQEDC
jgi:hypothetical protein